MKLIVSTLVSLAAVAFAAPAAELDTRANSGVYLCNDRGFTGYCVHIVAPFGTCVPLASDLNDKVSAAGPDVGSFCYFYVKSGCDTSGDFFHVGNPGVADLSVTPVNGPAGSTRNFEDKLSSYACFQE